MAGNTPGDNSRRSLGWRNAVGSCLGLRQVKGREHKVHGQGADKLDSTRAIILLIPRLRPCLQSETFQSRPV